MRNLFAQNLREETPVTPLPNPGEGGAVYPGNNMMPGNGNMAPGNGSMTPGNGSMMPGNGSMIPGSGGMMPEEDMPETDNMNRPVIPLPNPGEGGPVAPGLSENGTGQNGSGQNRPGGMGPGNMGPGGMIFPSIIGTIITSFPRPGTPCRFCQNQNQSAGTMRVLNAASGYNPFQVYVNDQQFVSSLNFSELTSYERVPSGYQIITVMGDDGYIYLQKPIMIPQDGSITVAICNTEGGLDLFVISDASCSKSSYLSCLRVCNLSYNSGPLSVVVGNNDLRFLNVEFQEVTNFRVLAPANYLFYVINSNRNIILSSELAVKNSVSYTMYLFNWNISSPDTITAVVVEER